MENLKEVQEVIGVIYAMPMAVIIWGCDEEILYCNERALSIFKVSSKNSMVEAFSSFIPVWQRDGSLSLDVKEKNFCQAMSKGKIDFLWTYLNSTGEEIPCEITMVKAKIGAMEIVVSYIQDLRALHRTLEVNNRLKKMAYYDLLTGVNTRAMFMQKFSQELSGMGGLHGLSLLMFDVDDFKKINDTYGHAAGDAILKAIVNKVKSFLPPNSMLGRFGGDEFMVSIKGCNQVEVEAFMENCVKGVSQMSVPYDGFGIATSISIGGTFCRECEKEGSVVLKRADKALYKAKSKGKNRGLFTA